MKARIGVILAAVLALAATLIIAAGNDLSETPLAAALASWCAALLLATAAIAVAPRRWWTVPAAISALYALACVSLAMFQLGAPLGLDADFILAAPKDSAKTLVKIVGGPATVLMVLAVAALTVAIAVSLRALSPRSTRFALIAGVLAIPTLAFLGLPH